jgi:hypothetical protein
LNFHRSISDTNTRTYLDAGQALEHLAGVGPIPDKDVPDGGTVETCAEVQKAIQRMMLAMSIYCAECAISDLGQLIHREKDSKKFLYLQSTLGELDDKFQDMLKRYANF